MCVRARQPRRDVFEPVVRCLDHPVDRAVRIGPDRRDQEQLVGQPVENEDRRRADEDHVGQGEPGAPRARDAFDETDRFIGEEADERRQRLGQAVRHIEAAFGDQIAQRL